MRFSRRRRTLNPTRMIKDLLDRTIEKRPTTLKFDGRFILQTQSDGAIDMLVVDFVTPGKIRAYARFDEEMVRAVAGRAGQQVAVAAE